MHDAHKCRMEHKLEFDDDLPNRPSPRAHRAAMLTRVSELSSRSIADLKTASQTIKKRSEVEEMLEKYTELIHRNQPLTPEMAEILLRRYSCSV